MLIALILALALPSSAITVYRRGWEAKTYAHLFVSDGEQKAWKWIAERVDASDVVLATAPSSLRLPRHVPAHVVAGHWTLSPEYERHSAETLAFFQGRGTADEAAEFLRRFGVDWIWVGPCGAGAGRKEGGRLRAGLPAFLRRARRPDLPLRGLILADIASSGHLDHASRHDLVRGAAAACGRTDRMVSMPPRCRTDGWTRAR